MSVFIFEAETITVSIILIGNEIVSFCLERDDMILKGTEMVSVWAVTACAIHEKTIKKYLIKFICTDFTDCNVLRVNL